MGLENNKSLTNGDIMEKIAEQSLKSDIQGTADEFFDKLFEKMIENTNISQDAEAMNSMLLNIEDFIANQLKIAENNIYFSRKIKGGHGKKAKLVITAEPVLKIIFEESMTKAFDKNLTDKDRVSLMQLFGIHHVLDNLTQTAFENVITNEQKNFKKQRRKQSERKNNVYYKEIEIESNSTK